jgi:hypothetical protein
MKKREVYVSTDIEADGPIPGPHSMLSFASAAYHPDKTLVGTFDINLELLPGATGHPKTMKWWEGHPVEWRLSRREPQPPELAMTMYVSWLKTLPGRPIFVAYPLGYDFTFVYWYLIRFAGECPFGHHGIDVRSYAMAMLKRGYRDCGKGDLPKRWFDDLPHTHRPMDDALEQGGLFMNMLLENSRPRSWTQNP